ncbi:aldo/keto reductase [Streptomyces sp. t39]|uniref:aldo/keto reductase n=1 Tax=Streptomyces sp. t39 TaxID=1828156 RepID=UPI0021C58264|nr:aldo/keto reductase [Streptomyces sp. t39]
MRTLIAGRTGVPLTRLLLGAAGIGNLYTPVTDEQAAAAVDAAWDAGVRAFDTAPHYGLGLSERRLGAALGQRPRGAFTLSTKVGRLLVPAPDATGDDLANGFAVPATHRRVFDFSADGVRRSLDASLRRLGTDHIDIAYLHDPDDHVDQALTEAYPALERLRDQGVVRAIGVGMNQSAVPARFVRDTDIDVVLVAGRYTLLDRTAHADLLPEARRRAGVERWRDLLRTSGRDAGAGLRQARALAGPAEDVRPGRRGRSAAGERTQRDLTAAAVRTGPTGPAAPAARCRRATAGAPDRAARADGNRGTTPARTRSGRRPDRGARSGPRPRRSDGGTRGTDGGEQTCTQSASHR